MNIRAARRDDCAAINNIYNHYVLHDTCTWQTEPDTLEERLAWFDSHDGAHPIFVLEEGARVVGWASLSVFNPRGGYRHTVEDSVYLAPGAHGRGLGTALLERLIEATRAHGHHTILALISAEKAASLALHRRQGFVDAGLLREAGHKLGQWRDVAYLQRMV